MALKITKILALAAIALCQVSVANQRPNFIIILTDDQGYQDLGVFGSPDIKTPNIDKMAAEGMKLTDFYVATAKCSPSRASLLSGVYPKQHGIEGVFKPYSDDGMPKSLHTIAEVVKSVGYQTACIGKWHLGHTDGYMPTDRGFDYYYGIPYSNDMHFTGDLPLSPSLVTTQGTTLQQVKKLHAEWPEINNPKTMRRNKLIIKNLVPLVEGKEIIEYPCDQATTSIRYAKKAIEFIEQQKGKNFFVYMAPAMPHTPLFASEQFKGKSAGGAYGDAIEEIDYAVGQILSYLESSGLSENTLVVFTSDNGPWLIKGDDGGHAPPLREGKSSSFEGGVRVPTVMKMPSTIPAGSVYNGVLSTIDLFPTIATMSGAQLPEDQQFDGVDFSHILADPTLPSPRSEMLLYDSDANLSGIRQGDWKLLIDTAQYADKKKPKASNKPMLFNLKEDIGETTDLSDTNPEKYQALLKLANQLDAELPTVHN